MWMTAGKTALIYKELKMSSKIEISNFLERMMDLNTQDCIEWPFSKDKWGYGRCQRLGERRAHRVSYKMVYGSIKSGMSICHKCDNPSCVNPLHLFEGTHQDNMEDMKRKGRRACTDGMKFCDNKGEKHGKAKLTSEHVKSIRLFYSLEQVTQKKLSEMYGVYRQAINDVINRVTWNH